MPILRQALNRNTAMESLQLLCAQKGTLYALFLCLLFLQLLHLHAALALPSYSVPLHRVITRSK